MAEGRGGWPVVVAMAAVTMAVMAVVSPAARAHGGRPIGNEGPHEVLRRVSRSAAETLPPGFTDRAVRVLDGTPGKVWIAVGALAGLFMASYTGVLLSVSNQPVWSDTWALGGLFLASGLSGATALIWWLVRYRPDARASGGVFVLFERIFALLGLALIVLFVLTLIPAGTLGQTFGFPWILLWLVAFAGLATGLSGLAIQRLTVTPEGAVAAQSARVAVAAPWLILLGVLALRAAVLFSVQ